MLFVTTFSLSGPISQVSQPLLAMLPFIVLALVAVSLCPSTFLVHMVLL